MATNVGRAEIDVNADGRALPGQLRRIARRAGRESGVAFDSGFNESGFKNVFRNAEKSFASMRSSAYSAARPLRRVSEAWKNLSHNTRQWTLIIGAVLSGMQTLTTLTGSLGGGLFVLGGSLTAVGVGLGATIAAFSGLAGDLDKMPASVRPAAKAFQDLKNPLRDLRDFLTDRAFAGSEKTFRSMGSTIRKLTPAFGPLGDVVRGLTDDFAAWAASEKGMKSLQDTVRNSAPIFDRLMRITGKLAGTLLDAFNNPRTQKAIDGMLTGLEKMFDRFDEWVNSEEFTQWMDDSMFILGKLGDLISATSSMLNELVTPEAIERTGKFLDNLSRFMPYLGDLLDFLGRLDPFGVLAQALADIGEAMEPLAEPLGKVADGLNRIISIAIDEWGDNLKGVSEVLAPILDSLGDMMKDIDEDVIRAIADALFYFGGALLLIKGIKLAGAITGLTGLFAALKKGDKTVKNFPLGRLKSIGGGLASFAAITAVTLIPDDFWDQFDIESNVGPDMLTGAAFGSMFGAWGVAIGIGIALVTNLFTNFEGTMNDTGATLVGLFTGGAMGAAGFTIAEWFARLVPEEWRTSDNPFELAMAAIAMALTDTGTALSLGLTFFQNFWADVTTGWNLALSDWTADWNAFWAALNNGTLWTAISTEIKRWFSGMLVDFSIWWASVVIGWNTFWGNLLAGAKAKINSIRITVDAWIIGMKSVISSGLNSARRGWDSFWNTLVNPVTSAAGAIARAVSRIVASVKDALRSISSLSGAASGAGSGIGRQSNIPRMASGGILAGPRRILAGEDGPEAIVPLRRSLNRVDPSVRALSAIAQGMTPHMAGGGVVGGGNVIEAGAIVVHEAGSALATSVEVLDRLARKLA